MDDAAWRALHQEYKNGADLADLCRIRGIEPAEVTRNFIRLGLYVPGRRGEDRRHAERSPRPPRPLEGPILHLKNEDDWAALHDMFLGGASIADLAKQARLDGETIESNFERLGLPLKRGPQAPSSQPKSWLPTWHTAPASGHRRRGRRM